MDARSGRGRGSRGGICRARRARLGVVGLLGAPPGLALLGPLGHERLGVRGGALVDRGGDDGQEPLSFGLLPLGSRRRQARRVRLKAQEVGVRHGGDLLFDARDVGPGGRLGLARGASGGGFGFLLCDERYVGALARNSKDGAKRLAKPFELLANQPEIE